MGDTLLALEAWARAGGWSEEALSLLTLGIAEVGHGGELPGQRERLLSARDGLLDREMDRVLEQQCQQEQRAVAEAYARGHGDGVLAQREGAERERLEASLREERAGRVGQDPLNQRHESLKAQNREFVLQFQADAPGLRTRLYTLAKIAEAVPLIYGAAPAKLIADFTIACRTAGEAEGKTTGQAGAAKRLQWLDLGERANRDMLLLYAELSATVTP